MLAASVLADWQRRHQHGPEAAALEASVVAVMAAKASLLHVASLKLEAMQTLLVEATLLVERLSTAVQTAMVYGRYHHRHRKDY